MSTEPVTDVMAVVKATKTLGRFISNPVRVFSSNDPGRNDPCPCGSGKRFKECCWWITNQLPSGKFTDLAIKIHNKIAKYIRKAVYLKRQKELYGEDKTK